MDIAIGVSLLSAGVSLTALINFFAAKRREAMAQGAKEQQLQSLKADLERAFEKIRHIEGCQHINDIDLAGLRKDIEYIKASVDDIKAMIRESTREGH